MAFGSLAQTEGGTVEKNLECIEVIARCVSLDFHLEGGRVANDLAISWTQDDRGSGNFETSKTEE
jgi:hypothetical protein